MVFVVIEEVATVVGREDHIGVVELPGFPERIDESTKARIRFLEHRRVLPLLVDVRLLKARFRLIHIRLARGEPASATAFDGSGRGLVGHVHGVV